MEDMKLTILVLSSSGGNYPVEVSDESGVLRMFCHCQAGSVQMMCRHKIALIKGDHTILYDQEQEKFYNELLSSGAYSTLKLRFKEYEKQITKVQQDLRKLKDIEKSIKTDFAYELAHGQVRKI
jgi:hypothetical protein